MFPPEQMPPRVFRRIFLKRSEIALSKLTPDDAEWLETWINDPTTTRWMATGRVPTTLEQVAFQIMQWQEPRDWAFAVLISDQLNVDGQFQAIGSVGLYDVDWLSRKAEFRIILGAPHTGKGYGTEATKLILDFGFGRLGLNRIWLGVTAGNVPAILTYIACGFRPEGVLRDDLLRDGHYFHSLRFGLTHADWVVEQNLESTVPCRCGCGRQIPLWRWLHGHSGARPHTGIRGFWAKVPKPKEGCWEWPSAISGGTGYGEVTMVAPFSGGPAKVRSAHRIAYESIYGPTELYVCHRCDNRRCVRPDHLYAGTNSDNQKDRWNKVKARRAEQCRTDVEKLAETSEPGPDTQRPAAGLSIGS